MEELERETRSRSDLCVGSEFVKVWIRLGQHLCQPSISPCFLRLNNSVSKFFLEVAFGRLVNSGICARVQRWQRSREWFAASGQHDKIHGVTQHLRVRTKLGRKKMKKAFLALAAGFMVLAAGTQSATAGCGTCDKTIVENAVASKDFATLVAAVKAAGLVETLSGDGPFTVFAPTEAAFAKLPKGTVADLVKPENKDKLVAILTYHVVPGKVMAKDVVKLDGKKAKTAQGGSVGVKVKDGTVSINKAKVVKADIACKNGVIHVIDTVLLPKSKK